MRVQYIATCMTGSKESGRERREVWLTQRIGNNKKNQMLSNDRFSYTFNISFSSHALFCRKHYCYFVEYYILSNKVTMFFAWLGCQKRLLCLVYTICCFCDTPSGHLCRWTFKPYYSQILSLDIQTVLFTNDSMFSFTFNYSRSQSPSLQNHILDDNSFSVKASLLRNERSIIQR